MRAFWLAEALRCRLTKCRSSPSRQSRRLLWCAGHRNGSGRLAAGWIRRDNREGMSSLVVADELRRGCGSVGEAPSTARPLVNQRFSVGVSCRNRHLDGLSEGRARRDNRHGKNYRAPVG